MNINEYLHTNGIYPVKLRLLGRSGYTLWASGETDRLLALESNVIYFKDSHRLRTFITSDTPSNLADHDGYRQAQTMIQQQPFDDRLEIHYDTYYFDSVTKVIARESLTSLSLRMCSTIVNILHMVWDIAVTTNESWSIEALRGKQTPLGELLDTLTYITKEEIADLGRFDIRRLRIIYDEVLNRISKRMFLII